MQAATQADPHTLDMKIEPELLRTLAGLSQRRRAEVLDFARFLGHRAERPSAEAKPTTRIELRFAPADTLLQLTGLVALGGDALADSEAFYDDNGSH